jgi:hypothetical protein
VFVGAGPATRVASSREDLAFEENVRPLAQRLTAGERKKAALVAETREKFVVVIVGPAAEPEADHSASSGAAFTATEDAAMGRNRRSCRVPTLGGVGSWPEDQATRCLTDTIHIGFNR